MKAFSTFYEDNVPRLRRKMEAFNLKLNQESEAILKAFYHNMADLNEGGKYLRGLLVNLGYRLSGNEDCEVSDAAALAFEIFQTGVLIHDDVIDRARSRRGKKTLTVRYEESLKERHITPPAEGDAIDHLTESVAICCGDYLITAASSLLSEEYASHKEGMAVIREFEHIILDTIRGELLDVVLPCEIQDEKCNKEADLLIKSVYDIYHLKTSRYSVVGPLRLGMLLGGMEQKKIDAVDAMADELGIAFQIKDDILGIYGDAKKTGKDTGSDISEYKQTLLYAYVKTRMPERMPELDVIYGKSNLTAEEVAKVQNLFEETGAKAFAEQEMEVCFWNAEKKLEALEFIKNEDKEIIRDFITYNRERMK